MIINAISCSMSRMKDLKPWYKKKLNILVSVLIVGLFAISGLDSNTSQNIVQPTTQKATVPIIKEVKTVTPVSVQKTSPPTQVQTDSENLSNDNYYTNTAGNKVHSPAYSNSVPAGASAQCRDGTYSFSQSRRGTCSHHGGVAEWL